MNEKDEMFENKTKIIEENGNEIVKDTSTNLLEFLIKEMENQLGDLNEKIAKLTEKIKYNKKWLAIWGPFLILLVCVSTYIPSVLLFILCWLIIVIGEFKCYDFVANYNHSKKSLHITELQSFYLKRVILKKKQELEELKESNQKIEVVEEESEIKETEDRTYLQNLRNHLETLKRYNKSFIEYEADKYARGFWGVEDKERVIEDGLDAKIYEDYLIEYNTRKLMKDKRTL